MAILYNEAFYTAQTFDYIKDAFNGKHVSGDGKYTKLCHQFLSEKFNVQKVLLTHSCTASLEMGAILAGIEHGDEVIMPSYTFVSTANAFVLRGAVPTFVDIRPDTVNLNEKLIEEAITPKTKAIVPVHYAGVGCEMDTILAIAQKHNLMVVEDAAQAFAATYKGKQLGTLGSLGAVSFHETKNIMSGEGGCLFINDENLNERAEIIREKGTNRSKFFRGQVDKYTWVDLGSSYLPSDLIAAYLYSTLETADKAIRRRLEIWNKYNQAFAPYEKKGVVRLPVVPHECSHNGHIFYMLFNDLDTRTAFIKHLKDNGIMSVFHYIPLHSSPAGLKYGRTSGSLEVTDRIADTLVRLPLFYELNDEMQNLVIEKSIDFLEKL